MNFSPVCPCQSLDYANIPADEIAVLERETEHPPRKTILF
jgi:hypothetical protein